MKQKLVKPAVEEEAALKVQNEDVIAYNGNGECGFGIICGSEW